MAIYSKVQGVNLHLDIELVVTRANTPVEQDDSTAETDYISAGGPLRLAGYIAPQDLLATLKDLQASLDDIAEAAYEMVMTLTCAGLKEEARACRGIYHRTLVSWIEKTGSSDDQSDVAGRAYRYLADMLAYDIDAQDGPEGGEA